MRPTTRGAGLVGLWLVALSLVLAVPSPAVLGVWAALGVPLVAGPVVCWRRRHAVASGSTCRAAVVPAVVPLAEPAAAVVSVRLAAGARWAELRVDPAAARWVRSAERARSEGASRQLGRGWAPALGRTRSLAAGPSAPIGSACTGSVRLPAPTSRRGVYRLQPMALWVHDPLGVVGAVAQTAPEATVIVYPRAGRRPDALSHHRPGGDHSDRSQLPVRARGRAGAGELVDLRPYRPGDRLALVHWRRVGLGGPLLARELAEDGDGPVRLVIDDRASVHRRASFEAALGTVTALLERPSVGTGAVQLGTLTAGSAVTASSGRPTAEALRWLALVQPRRPLGSRAGAAAKRPARLRPGDIVVTTATAAPSLQRMLPRGVHVAVAG